MTATDGSDTVCCGAMRAQLTWSCRDHQEAFACPDALIGQLGSGKFALYIHDGGTSFSEIRFCPWCGAALGDQAIPGKPHFLLAGSAASVRVVGDGLDPVEVTRLLGCEPDRVTARSWSLSARKHEPADLDAQIEALLARLTADLDRWRAVTEKYRVDLFCGLFLRGTNEGISISARSSAALGARRVELGLDIYGRE